MSTAHGYKVNHKLKSHPAPFAAVWSGEKMHEIRFNDRRFKVGHTVRLLEWHPEKKIFRGRAVDIIITYIRYAPDNTPDPFGLLPGFCVFDFLILNHFRKEEFPEESAGETFITPPPFTTMQNPEA